VPQGVAKGDARLYITKRARRCPALIPTDTAGQKERPMITITHLAADKVKEISRSEGLEGQGLRLRVIGGGCAGFQYDLYFEDKPTDLDERFESNGVALYIDPLSFQYLDQTEIDYVESPHGSGFKFANPNVSSTCGCGSSFKV
jgi:iron-sulfur cluster insertion protein